LSMTRTACGKVSTMFMRLLRPERRARAVGLSMAVVEFLN